MIVKFVVERSGVNRRFQLHCRTLFSLSHSSKYPHFEGGIFLVCIINNEHNHPVYCADSMRHRDVSDQTREEITGLFESGHSPSTALDVLKFNLQDKHGDDYLFLAADRAVCPDVQYCYR